MMSKASRLLTASCGWSCNLSELWYLLREGPCIRLSSYRIPFIHHGIDCSQIQFFRQNLCQDLMHCIQASDWTKVLGLLSFLGFRYPVRFATYQPSRSLFFSSDYAPKCLYRAIVLCSIFPQVSSILLYFCISWNSSYITLLEKCRI